jgi:hypothetical protein
VKNRLQGLKSSLVSCPYKEEAVSGGCVKFFSSLSKEPTAGREITSQILSVQEAASWESVNFLLSLSADLNSGREFTS